MNSTFIYIFSNLKGNFIGYRMFHCFICFCQISCLAYSEFPESVVWGLTLIWENCQSLLLHILLIFFLSLFFSGIPVFVFFIFCSSDFLDILFLFPSFLSLLFIFLSFYFHTLKLIDNFPTFPSTNEPITRHSSFI